MLKASGWKGYTFPAFVVRVSFEYLLHHDGPEPELHGFTNVGRVCACGLRVSWPATCYKSRTCSTH